MTPAEAGALFALLRANFVNARAKVSEATANLWLVELRRLDLHVGEAAVHALLARSRFWPTLAELTEQVDLIREQHRRAEREDESRRKRLAEETMPRTPLREIPAVVALLERWGVPLPDEADADLEPFNPDDLF